MNLRWKMRQHGMIVFVLKRALQRGNLGQLWMILNQMRIERPRQVWEEHPVFKRRLKNVRLERCDEDERNYALKKLKATVLLDPAASGLGLSLVKQTGALEADEVVSASFCDAFSAKAAGTLTKRASSLQRLVLQLYNQGVESPWRMSEADLYNALTALRDNGCGATAPAHILESLRFLHAIVCFQCIDLEAVISARCKGLAHSSFLGKAPLKQRDPLSCSQVKALEGIMVKVGAVEQCILGQVLFCVHAVCRWKDAQRIRSLELLGSGESQVLFGDALGSKTALSKEAKTKFTPYAALAQGLTECYALPTRSLRLDAWGSTPMGAAEASAWIQEWLADAGPEAKQGSGSLQDDQVADALIDEEVAARVELQPEEVAAEQLNASDEDSAESEADGEATWQQKERAEAPGAAVTAGHEDVRIVHVKVSIASKVSSFNFMKVGLTEETLQGLLENGYNTFGRLAFAVSATPTTLTDEAVDAWIEGLGIRPSGFQKASLRRLLFDGVSMAIEEVKARIEPGLEGHPKKLALQLSALTDRQAWSRRSLAFDLANLASFKVMEEHVQFLFSVLQRTQPKGFMSIQLSQIIEADKQMFILASNNLMGRLTASAGAAPALDSEITRLSRSPDIMQYLAPLQTPPTVQQPWKPDGKGGRKGKDKDGKGNKGAARTPLELPEGCVTKDDSNQPLCFAFNTHGCKNQCKKGRSVFLVMFSPVAAFSPIRPLRSTKMKETHIGAGSDIRVCNDAELSGCVHELGSAWFWDFLAKHRPFAIHMGVPCGTSSKVYLKLSLISVAMEVRSVLGQPGACTRPNLKLLRSSRGGQAVNPFSQPASVSDQNFDDLVQENLTKDPKLISLKRNLAIAKVKQEVSRHRDKELQLHSSMHPAVAKVMKGKNILALESLLQSEGYDDMGAIAFLKEGVRLVGTSECPECFDRKIVPAQLTEGELFETAAERREALLQKFEKVEPREAEALKEATDGEVAHGFLEGPYYDKHEVSAKLGTDQWTIIRRFVLFQGAEQKARPIDNCLESQLNAGYSASIHLRLQDSDYIASMALHVAKAISEGRAAVIIKGASRSWAMHELARLFSELDSQYPSMWWVCRVPSFSNPGDAPSRGHGSEAMTAVGASKVQRFSRLDELSERLCAFKRASVIRGVGAS
ncbi:unnamed protein product [Symbiodinium necroappetens]|uniref:Uncharacterized protein n=1 Tax=Symbiodinium necroappetens TaxID=1628268 RepID=A0A812W917_9DINO|nr:unnamed protein product [Symbiodinium necroappetens]